MIDLEQIDPADLTQEIAISAITLAALAAPKMSALPLQAQWLLRRALDAPA